MWITAEGNFRQNLPWILMYTVYNKAVHKKKELDSGLITH